ncbi:MAG: flagellar assembly protein FliH [Candidatus Eremiobacteraeota bacterium]|nr:flagellar assembly protein FliH [Candidatus Eremiobacteraeota bacterium]
MHDEFKPLASLFREPTSPAAAMDSAPIQTGDPIPDHEDDVRDAWRALAREVRIFRARLEDELAIALDALLPDVAADVLGRELRLQAADLARIVGAAVERYAHEEPLRVRVHPSDRDLLADLDVAIVCDKDLRRGDAVLELRSGTIDATLGARLETLLQESARR